MILHYIYYLLLFLIILLFYYFIIILFFCKVAKHVAGTLLFTILLFSLLFLLKFAHRPWPFFDDIIKVLFPGSM
jgi:hypothetical protein